MKKYGLMDRGMIRWFLVDYLSKPMSRVLISMVFFLASMLLFIAFQKRRAIDLLMTAQRLQPNSLYTRVVAAQLPLLKKYYDSMMQDDVPISSAASRSIIIKMPEEVGGRVDKGIINITFSNTNHYYYHHVDIEALQRYFHVVLEPSWAGYCLPEILFWSNTAKPVFVQSTEITDRIFLTRIKTNLVPMSFGASDWVNHYRFYPVEADKYYDSVYVANYTYVKRLHVYFSALRKIKAKSIDYRGAIVCASWGEHKETALRLIDYYDIADVLDVHESLKSEQINDLLARSKCNILLSLKEGSNRSLFESMFSDVPVIALTSNVGMNKDYINSSTGLLVDESRLVEGLLKMKSDYSKFSPRRWAMNNISPEVTTKKLLDVIASSSPSPNLDQRNVLVKTNDPEVTYLDKENGIDKVYFVEAILKLFNTECADKDREKVLYRLSDEFYKDR